MAADQANGNGAGPGHPAASVVITFAGPAGADPAIRAEGITPGQLMAAAFLLDCLAREVRAGQVARDAMSSVIPAPAELLTQLRRDGRI